MLSTSSWLHLELESNQSVVIIVRCTIIGLSGPIQEFGCRYVRDIPRVKSALSHPGSIYATRRRHASTVAHKVYRSKREVSISADAKAELLGKRLVTGGKLSAWMTSDADLSVSPRLKQFHFQESACVHSFNLRNPSAAINASFQRAVQNCNGVADPVTPRLIDRIIQFRASHSAS
jgi:hypothetical protein